MIFTFVILALIIPSVSVALGVYLGYGYGRAQRERLSADLTQALDALDELCETDLEAAVDEIGEPFVHAVERATGEIELTGIDVYDHEREGL